MIKNDQQILQFIRITCITLVNVNGIISMTVVSGNESKCPLYI